MIKFRAFRCLLMAFIMSMASAGCAQAQETAPASPYQPEVGQPGKDVVWVPTSPALVEKMLDLAKVTREDYVIDLGSGDGRTVIAATKRGARALGIEYNPAMVELSKQNAAKEDVGGKAEFMKADLFETDFSKATVISMFLLPDLNLKLRPKLLEMKPGTRLVSNSFDMGEWEADQIDNLGEGCNSWCTALLWIVPAKVEGTWRLPGGDLALSQKFQMLSGTLTLDGKSMPISAGRMNGDQIRFIAGGSTYTGSVKGNAIEGNVVTEERKRTWGATRVGN
jgi:hypothetical protein